MFGAYKNHLNTDMCVYLMVEIDIETKKEREKREIQGRDREMERFGVECWNLRFLSLL